MNKQAPLSNTDLYSKKQNSEETSMFGSECISMKSVLVLIWAFWCKLQMFVIPIAGSVNIYCDNESAVHSITKPNKFLKKKA